LKEKGKKRKKVDRLMENLSYEDKIHAKGSKI
jgi:hypothetical protein